MKNITHIYKNAYSGLSPATWWLSVVMLVNRSGTMVLPFMTLYLTETKNYPIGKAGLIMSVFGLGAVCGGILGGKLTDKLGFYNVQLAALLSGGAMFIALGQMESFPAICACSFILALLNDSFRPANATAVAQYSTQENRTRSNSLNRLAVNLGWAVGGALGGFIASKNYHLLFWIDGITNIGAALLLLIVLSPKRNMQTPAQKNMATKNSATRSVYKDKVYLAFVLLITMYGCCFFQIFSTQPVFFKQVLHLTPNFIGFVMTVNGLIIATFEMALVFTLEPLRHRHMHFVTIGALLMGLSFIIFNVLPGAETLALISTAIITTGEMLSMSFLNSFWIARTNTDNRGQYAGLYTAAWSIAQIAGPYFGSQTAQYLGYTVLWWGVGAMSVVTAIGFWWLQRTQRHA